MEGRPKTTGMIRLLWSLILGLGLTLGLLWALMPHSAAKAQDVNPGFTVDLTYDAIWGLLNPGDVVTVTRTAGGAAYGAAEADGVGFFWTPLWQSNGQPADIAGGDTIEVYVNGALANTLNLLDITGQVDVLTDQVVGTITGDTGGTPVTVTVGLEGQQPSDAAPQETTTTGGGGNFTVAFASVDLGAGTLVAIEYPSGGHTVRTYLYPNQRVFLVQNMNSVHGYADPGQQVDVTVYEGAGPNVRWSDSGTVEGPHGFYNIGTPGGSDTPQAGDLVEVDLGGGQILTTTIADMSVTGVDTALDQIVGAAPAGEPVTITMWQLQGYAQTAATADGSGIFTATFAATDLRPRDSFRVIVADAEGDESLLFSGAPFINVLLDPMSEWDCVLSRVDGPNLPITLSIQTATGVYTRENPITPSDAGNSTGYPGGGCLLVWGPDWGPINFTPGDTVTLQSPTWEGSIVLADVSWEADTANDWVSGEAPPGDLEVTVEQWMQHTRYPIHGSAVQTATAASQYTAAFTDFDVRDGGTVAVRHFDPTSDFATYLYSWSGLSIHYFEVSPPHGVGGVPASVDEVVTAWLYASDGTTLLASTSDDHDDNPWRFWLDDFGDYQIETGNWVTVTSESGWTAGLQVPDLTVQADEDTDLIWGEAPKALVFVEHGWKDGWDGRFVPVDDYALDRAFFGGDIQWGDNIATTYQAPNGNRVRRDFRWPEIIAHYDMEGKNDVWGHNAIEGNTIYVTVTHPISGVIATGTTTAGACKGCEPDEYKLDFPDGTIVPNNTVTVNWGDGLVDSTVVVAITANPDPDTDVVTGTAPAEGWLHANAKHSWGDWIDVSKIQVDASGVYTIDFGAEGWDIQYGDSFNVHYNADHGHDTQYSFWLGVPELSINKWNTGGYARPGGVVVYGISYQNNGNGIAEDTLIVDTLPSNTTWAGDTSGVVPGIGVGGVITWDLGDLAPGDEGAFMVTLNVSGLSDGDTIGQNCAVITTTTPGDYDLGNNDSCAGTVDVWDEDINVNVYKWPNPGDPTPGQEFDYTIRWCAGQGAAAGPVWLTDTLPLSTTLVRWTPEHWRELFWTEVLTTGGQLALYAPGLPGHMCEELNLRLLLNAGAPISTTLRNTAVITTPGDAAFDNESVSTDAHVSPPRYDMRLDKRVHSYVPVPGEWINYFIWYGNDGNMVTHVWVTDTVPNGLSYDYARWGGGDQPQADEPLPDPTIIGNQLVWDLGEVPVGGSRWFHVQMNISDTLSAGDVLTNCATIGIDGTETTPEDNTSCYPVTLNPPGPNLHVTKQHDWHGDGQLGYEIGFENIGDQTVNNVWITDTLPADTAFEGWWSWDFNFDWDRLISDTQSSDMLRWQFDYLEPGDYGEFEFNANLDDPGVPLRWYTNTVEIETPPGDTNPDDNIYEDVAFSGGEVNWVDLDVGGNNIWGDVPDGPITITTVYTQIVAPWGGYFDERFDEPFQPGDVVTVEAGAGTHPVVIHVPDPFTAYASSITDTVWGQIDALDHEWIDVNLDGEPTKVVQTDGSGNYSTTLPDVPRGGSGEVRYNTEIDYADVVFHRRFQAPDLVMRVDYYSEHVYGEGYEPGHTVWITVTDGGGTVKATAVVSTVPDAGWGEPGFSAQGSDWLPSPPDIVPGDWVYGLMDNGQATQVHVGEITGTVDIDDDSVSGRIYATWFTQTLDVDCHPWSGSPPGAPSKQSTAGPNGDPPYYCHWDPITEWDVEPGQEIGVWYIGSDANWVGTGFHEPTPYLRISKGADGPPGEGGNFAFNIQYWNDGDGDAEDTVITDTLLGGMTYITDTSSFTHTGSGTPADPIVWDLGTLPASSSGEFCVFVEVTAVESDTITNTVQIATSNPYDQGDPWEKESTCSEHVQGNDTHLNVGKSAWTGDPAPGTDFVYDVNVCNNGSTASSQVTLTDTLHPSMTLQTWWGQHAGWTEVASGSNLLVVSRPSLPGGWCSMVYLRVHLDESAWPGMYITNTAVISATNDLEDDDNEAFWDGWVNYPHTNLNINKWWSGGQLVPGGRIHYSISYHNNGNVPVENVFITDTLPVSTTLIGVWLYDKDWNFMGPVTPTLETLDYVVWEVGTVENGDWGNFHVELQVDDDAIPGTILTNTAEISPQPDEDDYKDNVATVVETLYDHGPNLRVRKEGRWDDWGEDTRRASYWINIENVGDVGVNHVTITDTYPISMVLDGGIDTEWWRLENWLDHPASHYFTATFQRLGPGDGTWLNFGAIVPGKGPLPFGLIFTNTAEVTLDPGDTNPADNIDDIVLTTGPDLYVKKKLVAGDLLPGEIITFTLIFGNDREGHEWWWNMQGDTQLTDILPDGLEYIDSTQPPDLQVGSTLFWILWPINAGDQHEIYLTARITDTAEGDDVFTNRVEIASGQPGDDIEPYYGNNSDSYDVVIALPKFEVGKVYESSRVAGTVVTYTLTVTNVGSESGTNVVLSDTLPAGLTYGGSDGSFDGSDVTWTFGSIAANGGTAMGWFWGTLDCTAGLSVGNEHYRVVSSDQGITTPDGDPVSLTIVAPTLSPAFDQSATEVIIGEAVYFTDTSTTDGAGIVAWAWDFGDGETGSGATTSHAYDALGAYTVTLTITDTCSFADSTVVSNAVAVLQPKFTVGKVYESSRVAGTVVTYTLTVTNAGNEAGTNVVLSDTLPAGLTYGGGDGSFDGSDVTWTLGSIAANGGTAAGWFWGTLDCTAGLTVDNEHYRVVSSDQRITSPDGDPISFTTVAPTLSPAFDQSATEVIIGETVYFTDTSTTDGTGIVAWAWDFGDGETDSGATTSHTYDAAGAYTVTLTITDTCGFTDSTAVSNAVIVSEYEIYLPLVLRNHS